jgi:hypothetical protein
MKDALIIRKAMKAGASKRYKDADELRHAQPCCGYRSSVQGDSALRNVTAI